MLNDTKKIILIGGSPTAGKSTITKQLSKYLGIPWISTDQIRDLMRTTVNENDFPVLFHTKDHTAESYLKKYSVEEIVDEEKAEAEAVWVGVKWFIENDYTWEDGFIIEGVGILPHLVARDFKKKTEIKSVFLVDEDSARIRDVVFNRGLWADASTYSDEVKEKEVEWVMLFGHNLKAETEKYDYPLISICKQKEDFQALLKVLELE
jgi:2-phosphoglycerate kinase